MDSQSARWKSPTRWDTHFIESGSRGGGKGIVKVDRAEQLHQLFHQVTTEARSAFGNGDVYIEKCVTSLRHIEAQVLRDTHGIRAFSA